MHRLWLVGICTVVTLGATVTAQEGLATTGANIRTSPPRLLPGTRAAVFSTIQGNALDSTNGALPNTPVRLRDARYGRIAASQATDTAGVFSFGPIDPGLYIVELLGKDNVVVAASQLLTASPGETVTAVVKLPFKIPPFAGILGHTVQQALAITSAAAASGVLATEVTGVDASSR